jgi:hypothetical protein
MKYYAYVEDGDITQVFNTLEYALAKLKRVRNILIKDILDYCNETGNWDGCASRIREVRNTKRMCVEEISALQRAAFEKEVCRC